MQSRKRSPGYYVSKDIHLVMKSPIGEFILQEEATQFHGAYAGASDILWPLGVINIKFMTILYLKKPN
eukprot:snap_masked-scaffold_34-processed-gene-2.14-mRNA-1 protein AED:1.00 eAED:1.00 QI:0/-1/0/0/-1/1/1/0/67